MFDGILRQNTLANSTFLQIYIEKHATYYTFSNIVLNLSNLTIWFFLVQIFCSILSMYLSQYRYPRKTTLNLVFYFYLLAFLNKYNVWHIKYSSLWQWHHHYLWNIIEYCYTVIVLQIGTCFTYKTCHCSLHIAHLLAATDYLHKCL